MIPVEIRRATTPARAAAAIGTSTTRNGTLYRSTKGQRRRKGVRRSSRDGGRLKFVSRSDGRRGICRLESEYERSIVANSSAVHAASPCGTCVASRKAAKPYANGFRMKSGKSRSKWRRAFISSRTLWRRLKARGRYESNTARATQSRDEQRDDAEDRRSLNTGPEKVFVNFQPNSRSPKDSSAKSRAAIRAKIAASFE